MRFYDIYKKPAVLVIFGMAVILILSIIGGWQIIRSSSSSVNKTSSDERLPIESTTGSIDNLQAAPVPLQAGDYDSGQAAKSGANQLQPQQSITPTQLQDLQQ